MQRVQGVSYKLFCLSFTCRFVTGTGRRSMDQELRMVWEEKKMNSQRIFLMEIDPTGPSEGFSHPQTQR